MKRTIFLWTAFLISVFVFPSLRAEDNAMKEGITRLDAAFQADDFVGPGDRDAAKIVWPDIITAEQTSGKVILFKAESDWNQADAVRWEWDPATSPDLKEEERVWFSNPDECKPVMNATALLTTASGGGVALIRLSDKKVLFHALAGGNPHSAALLPDGNIAIVSSQGNKITLFAVPGDFADSPDGYRTEYPFTDAHGVLWDNSRQTLWVLGGKEIGGFAYNHDKKKPELTPVEKTTLPVQLRGGHDLYPLPESRLFIVTGTVGVGLFDPATRIFTPVTDVKHLKSVSLCGDRLLIQKPKKEWWSDSILYGNRSFQIAGKRDGAKFYKARWWVDITTASEKEDSSGSSDGKSSDTESLTPIVWRIERRTDIAPVWSGHPVSFAFLERKGILFIGFYDALDRSMTIGRRESPDTPWTFKKLPTAVGWDSHNSIALIFDRDDILHVSGNMHCAPLIYFRADKPLDIESLTPIGRMTAEDDSPEAKKEASEDQVTYPHFDHTPDGRILFTYRDGSSGNGSQFWNVYDEKSRRWTRFLDRPLFDGEGRNNAYFVGPTKGLDGYYHVAWVWRETPDCSTNHDLSYMRSHDLIHWEKSDGSPITLPVTVATGEVIAPLKNGGGLLNSLIRIGFDAEKRPIITYSRHDEKGHFQIMQARRLADGWETRQTTDWTHAWDFSGNGSIFGRVSFSGVTTDDKGRLTISWNHKDEKSGRYELDPVTLKATGPARSGRAEKRPSEIFRRENDQEGQSIRSAEITDSTDARRRYRFVWETLSVNRDQPRDIVPKPSMLRLFEMVREP